MASLKNIMNTDDEHVDPRSGSRSSDSISRPSLRPNLSAAGSSYATSLERSTSSSSHNNGPGPPSSLTISSIAGHSSSSNTIRDMTSRRRRSNTSVDSNEMSHGSNQPGSSSSNTPMRPFTASMGSGEPHIKLTPITRKISKAKKGVPVHTCNQCPKTFSRAEHLRRHQKSHSSPELYCQVPGCNRSFYRKDLLDRHLQKHEQDDKDSMNPKQSTTRRNSKASSQPCTNTTRGSGLQIPGSFHDPRIDTATDSGNNSTVVSGAWQSMTAAPSAGQSYTGSSNMTGATENYMDGVRTNYTLGPTPLPTTNDAFVSNYSEPRDMPELSMLAIPDLSGTPEMRWRDSSVMASSASESTFSTPSDNTRQHQFPIRTSSGDWVNPISTFQPTGDLPNSNMENGGYSIPFTYSNSPPQGYQSVFDDNMGLPLPGYAEASTFGSTGQIASSTARSMSPPLAMAQSETLVAAPSMPLADQVFNLAGCGSQPPNGGSMLTNMAAPTTIPLSAAASEAVPAYLKVYWDKVHRNYPILHKHTFGKTPGTEAEHLEVLRYAMAAVATQFLSDKDDRMNGAQLHAYAWQKSKVFTQSEEWSLTVNQTIMLCEYYARFRGKKNQSHKPSSRFTSLYHRVVGPHNIPAPVSSVRDTRRAWETWVGMESQRRLLAACFLLDVHSSRYHERQLASIAGLDYSSPSTLPIPLTAVTTQLWEAHDAQTWAKLRTRKIPKAISSTNLGTLSASDLASAPSFDAAVILAACSLYLPRRQGPMLANHGHHVTSIQAGQMTLSKLFPESAVANTYLALHHTPLYCLLSVSGDSWVFNKKVPQVSSFTKHQELIEQWRGSGSAVVATVFAARALKAFLSLSARLSQTEESKMMTEPSQRASWTDISDYWGVYVCALICWAFGLTEKREISEGPISREVTTQWIEAVASLEPADAQSLGQRYKARGVVSLAREELAVDCLGGRNVLFADAVGVLTKLERETTEAD
ncbi:hypothetical protein FZEAL_1793 [Fusarium zealandicum]|uniref:C2H2-type domain-containing protein n=1 Tax=Fusarium zealandicum TaxID=1053134 RepID=A0A8H4USQ9_9HYPO|nr:hypothetical protein FZEAL_1793 [Fusarium zealandicum]